MLLGLGLLRVLFGVCVGVSAADFLCRLWLLGVLFMLYLWIMGGLLVALYIGIVILSSF